MLPPGWDWKAGKDGKPVFVSPEGEAQTLDPRSDFTVFLGEFERAQAGGADLTTFLS